MKSRRRILLGAAALLCLLLSIPFVNWLTEPRYEGKRVSVWFNEFCAAAYANNGGGWSLGPNGRTLYAPGGGAGLPDPAKEALEALGSPGIDYLTKQLSTSPLHRFQAQYLRLYGSLPGPAQRILPNPVMRDLRRQQAVAALVGMPRERNRALPKILAMIVEEPQTADPMTLSALRYFDFQPANIETLVFALTNSRRHFAVRTLLRACPVHTSRIAQCIAQIMSAGPTEPWIYEYLRDCGGLAAPALPILIQQLSSTNSETRYQSVRTIAVIGPAAVEAIPAITKALDDESEMVQSAARRALPRITSQNINPPQLETN